jgi:hypothetical protein
MLVLSFEAHRSEACLEKLEGSAVSAVMGSI